jgi:hypothetical protein
MSCCNVNFMSQYAFVNEKQIHINNYIDEYKGHIICQNGHQLIPVVNVNKRIPHFRHKNLNDVGGNPMTLWHSEWQAFFPITEKTFPLKTGQIKERRADVVLNNNKILEIQHSKYEKNEIENRKHDYNLHNINIIWLVDGNTGIKVKKLELQNRVFLEFVDECWKYESFKCYDYIYIDINSYIYKINPTKVKSHMIDVETPKTREQFINFLNDGIDIWTNEEPEQCNLYIRQQGAGNGKTFGIIKMLEDKDKSHYKNFIFITKQHSAKHIIKLTFEEIKNDTNNMFCYLKNIQITETNKKYIITYFNTISNQDTTIIIATIDSFTYSVGNKNHTYFDKFEGLIYSIIDGYIETKKCGTINFTSINPRLNKETLLVIDEFQDPPEYYGKAIIQIMLNKYIDVYIVGDKLQSISNEKNAFTYFLENEFPSINIVKLEPTNICRRFIHPTLVNFVNFMIPFKKYDLPEITPHNIYDNTIVEEPIIFIKGKPIDPNLNTEKNEETITNEVDKIMKCYEVEVSKNNRFPEDFLIVTPFTKNNPLVEALLLHLNIFWKRKFMEDENHMVQWKNKLSEIKRKNTSITEKDSDNIERILNLSNEDYNKYAIFHKSEEGSSIDLSESDYATRIVSCHASKGDGRKVVFNIGFNESGIKRFSQISNNLVYHSLLHVAITRMKEKLYIYFIDNGDDISYKINKYITQNCIIKKEYEPFINIKNKIKYSELFCENKSTNFQLFYKEIIEPCNLTKIDENNDETKIVDMGNHMIRYACLDINLKLEIINRENFENEDIKKQFKAILHKVSQSDITESNSMKGYYALMKIDKEIPIMKISNYGRDYINYYNIIFENIKNIQTKLKDLLIKNIKICLCPLECIILYYMIQIVNQKQFSDITIQDLYNIIDIYSCSFCEEFFSQHTHCLCCNHFYKKKTFIHTSKIDNMQLYLFKHFEKMNTIKSVIDMVYTKMPKINWLDNNISFYEGNDTFKLYNKYNFIGYNDTSVLICYIKPQFNGLNYNDVLLDSIYDTYFLYNIKQYNEKGEENNNYKRFHGKNVITCIFSLDLNEPYYIDWVDEMGKNRIKENEEDLLIMLYKGIMEKYKSEHGSVYNFYSYWRDFCPENERKPLNFIRFLKGKISGCETLRYINDFLARIEFRIETTSGKNAKEQILLFYYDKDNFLFDLEKELEKSVKNYLNIIFDDEDEDD